MAERAVLITELRVQDELSGKLGAAKAQLTQLDATARKTGTSLGGLGSSLGGIAKAGATAFVAFKALDLASDFLGGAIKGAIEEEAGLKRLGQALQANVADWDGNTAAIERTIEARTALGFKDDELRSSFGSLVTATRDINAAFAIQSTAIDLARFKSISLEDATARLIKVNAGSFRALKDLGIELKAGASGMQALGEVQLRVAGQGAGFLDTTAGSLARAEAAVDKLSDAIGERLAPAIADGADALTDFLSNDLPSFAENSQREIDELAGFFQDLIGAVRDLASIEDPLPDFAAAAVKAGTATLGYVAAERAATAAATTLAAAVDDSTDALLEQVQKALDAKDAAAELKKWMDFAGDSAAELNNDLLTAASGMDGFTFSANTATAALGHFNREASKTPPQVGVDEPRQNFVDDGPGAHPVAAKLAREKQVAAARTVIADRTLADAKRRATEESRAYETALGKAFDAAKTRASSLFDTLHNRHVQAIRDAETLAEKQHSGALQLISDTLKAQLAVNAGPVTAAQAALSERQQAQSRRGLVESLSAAQVAAQSNTDPEQAQALARALRDATEALENFDDAAKIARLTTVQGTEDAKAQSVADAATLKADAALTAAKAQAQKDLDAETVAAQKRKKDFENALAKLEAADLKAKKSPAEQKADIAKLEERFGITTDPVTGFHHITDPLVTAIKNIAPPIVNVTFNPVFNAVFQVGARAVAAALASQSSPTSTPMVRTGAAGRS